MPTAGALTSVIGKNRVFGRCSAYIMVECMAKCPQCKRPVNENTLWEC